jgi:folate-binding Fe-S cluster repair protein YgfZ
MTTTIHWDDAFPMLRLEGKGARDFLQGQTTADLSGLVDGELQQSCWLTATGRLRALLELRLDATGADVLVLAGDAEAVSRGFDQVIFPADRVRLNESRRQRRVQGLDPVGPALWIGKDQPLPEELNASTQLEKRCAGTPSPATGLPAWPSRDER